MEKSSYYALVPKSKKDYKIVKKHTIKCLNYNPYDESGIIKAIMNISDEIGEPFEGYVFKEVSKWDDNNIIDQYEIAISVEDFLNVDKLTHEKFLDKSDGYINGEPNYYITIINFYGKELLLPNPWDFVEKYLPNYYTDDDVALSNDLGVIEENSGNVDEGSGAFFVMHDMCGGDWTKAERLRTELDENLYKKAILNYIEEFNLNSN